MRGERVRTDISQDPDLLRLAQEVRRTGVPHVLLVGDEEIAVMSPAHPDASGHPDFKEPGPNDWLMPLEGMFRDDGPGDVSENTDHYLAQAYWEEFNPPDRT